VLRAGERGGRGGIRQDFLVPRRRQRLDGGRRPDGGSERARAIAPTARLRPRPDGLLDAEAPPELPLMSPRLQGELASDGTLTLSVWGVGEVGRLKVEGLAGPLVVGPNRIGTGG